MKTSMFDYRGHRLAYRDHGQGSRVLVFTHGLLMDQRMYERLAPEIARRGFRVITVDMLGHGASDQPYDMTHYSMTEFGRQVVALLDHLGVGEAVIGGTSLGANISLEVAVAAPDRVRALVLEMPVLEHALPAAAAAFVPLAMALRINQPAMRALAAVTRRIPRTRLLIDMMLDFLRRDPRASLAVLDGILFGRVAPDANARRAIPHRALVIGHPSDPIHPFGDADHLSHELANARLLGARSIAEWRLWPRRLDDALAAFLDEVWTSAVAASA
jgi:pimeloyl-ACP methyl ester carboxylesterase